VTAPRTLYRRGRVRSPADPFATALLVTGDTIAWIGGENAADSLTADTVVDLDDALLAPAFVDAHVHTTATGLAAGGLDLDGAPTRTAALDRLTAAARHRPGLITGTNWDETSWPDRRAPTTADLAAAAPGREVYLSRVDGHTAVISGPLAARTGAPRLAGWHGDGLVTGAAHHAARAAVERDLRPADRATAQRTARAAAAAAGIAALHEMGGPEVSSAEDLAALIALAAAEPGPAVAPYWAGDLATALELGAGWGGDAFVDGSFGSRTAALRAPYADAGPGSTGESGRTYLSVTEIRDAVLAATAAGTQAGFHAIGDAAIDAVLAGVEAAAARLGRPAIIAAAARIEHCELLDADQISRLAGLGLTAIVQPAFDARWGGPDGMYATRLGPARAASTNPFAALAAAGVPLALSSDAPVTPLDPWGAVAAACQHHTPAARLSARAAFTAATRGGWRAARADGDGHGVLAPGAPATFAVWHVPGELVGTAPDGRVAAPSIDPRADPAGLPDLTDPKARPDCLRTVLRGQIIHDLL